MHWCSGGVARISESGKPSVPRAPLRLQTMQTRRNERSWHTRYACRAGRHTLTYPSLSCGAAVAPDRQTAASLLILARIGPSWEKPLARALFPLEAIHRPCLMTARVARPGQRATHMQASINGPCPLIDWTETDALAMRPSTMRISIGSTPTVVTLRKRSHICQTGQGERGLHSCLRHQYSHFTTESRLRALDARR